MTMIKDLTLRKKLSLIFFLIALIRKVYICLTTTNCKGCAYEQLCDQESEDLCHLITALSLRIKRYIVKEEA